MSSLVVKPHRPWKTRVLSALLGVAVLAGGWTTYQYGRYQGGFDLFAARHQQSELRRQQQELETEIARLREANADLERARQVEHQAYGDLGANLRKLQAEVLELKEELAFYRGIVSPRGASRGLHVQSFELEPTGVARTWRYKLVLTQVLKNDTYVRGRVEVAVRGLRQGKPQALRLADVSANSVKALDYRFRYFQNFEGRLLLPEGFLPQQVTVRVLPHGRERDAIEKTYDWPARGDATHVGTQQEGKAESGTH